MKKKFPSKKELDAIRKKLDQGEASEVLPKTASVVDTTKYEICRKFVIYKREQGVSQRKLAKLIDVHEAVMSKILHYHIKDFTTERLLRYLAKIYPDAKLKVKVA